MFLGFFKLGIDTVIGTEQARIGDVPVVADTFPTFEVIDGDGNVLASGVCVSFGSYTGAYKFSFSTDNTFQRGMTYLVRVAYTVDSGSARASEHNFIVS